jgi:hypothetical protein
MRTFRLGILLLLLCTIGTSACSRQQDDSAAVATPAVTLARSDIAVGSPVEMTYKFTVAPNATFNQDYTVFVHFVDKDRELMFTDDHEPPTPTRQWKPGQTVEYSRTMFIPRFPYTGETHVEVGLYSRTSGERLVLAGENQAQRSYKVAEFTMRPQTDNLFIVFKDGWQDTEGSSDNGGLEWQWSRKDGVLSFRNPMRDALFYLQLDQPVDVVGPQHVDVKVGETVVDSFDVVPGDRQLHKINISKDQFGSGESSEITISVPKVFVPAAIPELKSSDARELGVRVFRAYLQLK